MNNKGTTLVELIISIALISVVLAFLVRMLVNINDTETNNDYAKKNQIVRSEIIRVIQNDMNGKVISNVVDTGSLRDNLVIEIVFSDGTKSKISATEKELVYQSPSNNIRKWTMENGRIYTEKCYVNYSSDTKASGEKIYTLSIDIEVHTTNSNNTKNNNNTLDDIIISYIGKVSDFNKNISCLGDAC